MRHLISAALLTLLALPALAVTPQAGDMFVLDANNKALLRVDPGDGQLTVISCWDELVCTPLVGAGIANWVVYDWHVVSIGSDGWIYLHGLATGQSPPDNGIYRVNPVNGNRELVANLQNGVVSWGAGNPYYTGQLSVWPAPAFFPPTVASRRLGARDAGTRDRDRGAGAGAREGCGLFLTASTLIAARPGSTACAWYSSL